MQKAITLQKSFQRVNVKMGLQKDTVLMSINCNYRICPRHPTSNWSTFGCCSMSLSWPSSWVGTHMFARHMGSLLNWAALLEKFSHPLFLNLPAKEFHSANYGQIILQDSISFHLSYQPPLKVTCHFLCCKSDTFTT